MSSSLGMSYARNLLEKYGWTEGKGLGKTESGIAEALKPKLKFDNTGIGHDHAEQFTFNWWEVAFNEAAKRVSVSSSKDNPEGHSETNDLCISTKRPSVTKLMKENPLKYGKFIKTETLKNGGELVPVRQRPTAPEEDDGPLLASSSNLSDEELFKICGGRTAHKAARHGHKLVGKLARVIEQEKEHLSILERSSKVGGVSLELADEVNVAADGRKRKKKKKKIKEDSEKHEKKTGPQEAQCGTNKGMQLKPLDTGIDLHKHDKKKNINGVEVHMAEIEYLKISKKNKRRHSECSSLNESHPKQTTQVVGDNVCEVYRRKRKKKKTSCN